jgi:hypothetical protein
MMSRSDARSFIFSRDISRREVVLLAENPDISASLLDNDYVLVLLIGYFHEVFPN